MFQLATHSLLFSAFILSLFLLQSFLLEMSSQVQFKGRVSFLLPVGESLSPGTMVPSNVHSASREESSICTLIK